MAWLANLVAPLVRLRDARRLEAQAVDAEAQDLIAEKSRDGALWAIREQMERADGDARVRRRLIALQAAIFRLAPRTHRGDTATRMLYREG